jgi:hypothetical protein
MRPHVLWFDEMSPGPPGLHAVHVREKAEELLPAVAATLMG